MSKNNLGVARILPPDAVNTLTNAWAVASNLPEGSASRARVIQRAIDEVMCKYPEFFVWG